MPKVTVADLDLHLYRKLDPDPYHLGSRIRIPIKVNNRIRIRIKVKIQELWRIKMKQ
jgi:hypothetical protein